MLVEFADNNLSRLEKDANYSAGFDQSLVRGFRKMVNTIRQALDERDFYALKSLHFEKLSGKRKHQYSMRLNDQFRLIIELINKDNAFKIVRIMEITDYH